MKQRESFSSRLGFLLISAGCAIGLGNVWRFPYITGQYGGAAFVVVYLMFLIIMGLPVMVMEFSVGRGSQKSMAGSFQALEPKGTRWHWYSWFGLAGNYLLMMFYTSVSGWLIFYCIKMAKGDFTGLDTAGVSQEFGHMLAQPGLMTVFMALVVVGSMLVVSRGLEKLPGRGQHRRGTALSPQCALLCDLPAAHYHADYLCGGLLEPIFRLMGNGRGFPAIFVGKSYFSLACESA